MVLEAKHCDAPDGASCFYLECDDMESYKKVTQFFMDNDMIQKTKTGKLYNIISQNASYLKFRKNLEFIKVGYLQLTLNLRIG